MRLRASAWLRARSLSPVAILSVVPLSLFALAENLRASRGPYHLGVNSDPDYAYLLNALNVVSLTPPDLYEHPGIPVEVLGAVAIVATWLFGAPGSAQDVQDSVLANPEVYLRSISTFFTILIGAAALFAGIRAFQVWKSLPAALAFQLSMLLFAAIPAALPRVTPEPVLIVAGLLLAASLFPFTVDRAAEPRWVPSILVGVAMGFGLATKFTFLPLLGFIVLLPGWPNKARAIAASGLAFLAFTSPVAMYYRYMAGWVRDLAVHKGVNAGGDVGFPELGILISNAASLIPVATPLFALAALCLTLAATLWIWDLGLGPAQRTTMRTLFVASGLVFSAQIALTAKQPSGHYMVPSMAVSGVATAGLLILVRRVARKGLFAQALRSGVLVLLAAGLLNAGAQHVTHVTAARVHAQGIAKFEAQVIPRTGTLVGYYGSPQLVYALAFGNDFARSRYDTRLHRLYPDALFYSIWPPAHFYSFAGEVEHRQISELLAAGHTVLLYGFPLVDGYAVYQRGLVLQPILVEADKAVYRLVGFERAQLPVR